MAALLIENRKIVLNIVLEAYSGNEDFRDYLIENIPDAQCDLVVALSSPNGSYEEYLIQVDSGRESILLLTLRDFCDKNKLTHQIDVAD